MEFLFEKLLNDNIQNEDYLSSLKICEKIINKYKDKYELIQKQLMTNKQYPSVNLLNYSNKEYNKHLNYYDRMHETYSSIKTLYFTLNGEIKNKVYELKYTEDTEDNGSFENEYLASKLYLDNKLIFHLKDEDEIIIKITDIIIDIKVLCKLIDFPYKTIDIDDT